MSELTSESIHAAIASHPDPETGRTLESMGQIKDIVVEGNSATITLGITSHSRPIADEVADAIESKIVAVIPGTKVEVKFVDHPRPPARLGQVGLRVKSVIAVGSGKGGVGKSTVAASIALTLRQLGSKVGLMDADVYGPSIPHLLGLSGRPSVSAEKKIEPIMLTEPSSLPPMPVMSMGFLVEPDQAVIWRGPMLHGSINQFLGETNWGELDYLVIDLPPGTGDVVLTLSQALPLAGSVVVCTPQEVALLDAIKAISMFRKVNIPILGMVENMSGFQCPGCHKTYDIFGRGGAREKAEELKVPFLGDLPINIDLRTAGDEGQLAQMIAENATAQAPLESVAKALVRTITAKAAQNPPKPTLPTL
ncbi:antiporter inner membrane protein [Planctomycetes bacterium CA13]|uniref:Iron-sulfur cluster carrier protein n=1 Tax=Novipirellula herctigrandis TaxID=2527986 RepID=A0A5C5Z3W8_9BACT|nr:antiporter inner membrane protein [Planctomycetes bacterium CA13]